MSTEEETYLILKYGSIKSAYNTFQVMGILEYDIRNSQEYHELREYFKKHGWPEKVKI